MPPGGGTGVYPAGVKTAAQRAFYNNLVKPCRHSAEGGRFLGSESAYLYPLKPAHGGNFNGNHNKPN